MKNRRHFNRKLLRILPPFLRYEWMRKKVKISTDWPSDLLEIKIAETEEELEQAFRLLHDSYVNSGYMDPDPSGLRVLRQHLLPQTTNIIAKWDGKVVGTVSLIRDNPFGLPLEDTFDISEHRTHGKRLAEVSSLAIDPAHRGKSDRVLFPLIRFCLQYAFRYFGTHEFVIATTPSMADMYLAFVGFERLKEKAKPYSFVKNTVAVGTYLNVETVVERWRQAFAHRPSHANLYKYWTEIPTDPRNRMPTKQFNSASDPIITPELMQNFFLHRAQLARKLSYKDVQTLLDIYPFPKFQNVLRPLLSNLSRKDIRLDTFIKAEIISNGIKVEVLNVSKEGLLLRAASASASMAAGQQIDLIVWLNEFCSTELKVEVRWRPERSLYGLVILESTPEWQYMVEVLEQEYAKSPIALKTAA